MVVEWRGVRVPSRLLDDLMAGVNFGISIRWRKPIARRSLARCVGKAGTNNSCRCQAFVVRARKYLQEYVEVPATLDRMLAGLLVLTWQVLPSSGTIGLYTTHRSLEVVCRSDSFGPRKSSRRTGANSCQPRKRITKRINVFICHTTLAKFTALIHRPPVLKRW